MADNGCCHIVRLLSVAMIAFFSAAVSGGIYQWKDENGKIHFSDNAPKNRPADDIEARIQSRSNTFSDTVNAQQKKLRDAFPALIRPADPDRPELFLVTVAGDAKQDVFMRETLYIQDLFRSRYEIAGHSTALVNNRSTTGKYLVASDATHTSFGCGDDRDFTYYGEAIFKKLMSAGVGLVAALDQARGEVYKMEQEKNTDHHSNPQFMAGEAIQKKIASL